MYDYGARFYMPDIGRFGTVDPRSQYTHEAYSYVWNNPVQFNDPTGMEGEEGKCPPNCPSGVSAINILPSGQTETSIQEITLTGKAADKSFGPGSLAMSAFIVSQADSPVPGPGDVIGGLMLIGAGVWWTYDYFATPSTGYTTIADPGAGMRNLKAEDAADKDKDVNGVDVPKEKKVPVSGKTGKEAAKDVPSWVKEQGEAPYVDEDGKTFAERVLDQQYGKGVWNKGKASKGPGSDFNKIKKWGDRGFEKPKPKK